MKYLKFGIILLLMGSCLTTMASTSHTPDSLLPFALKDKKQNIIAIRNTIKQINKKIDIAERTRETKVKTELQLQLSDLYLSIKEFDLALISANNAAIAAQEDGDDYHRMTALTQMGICYYHHNYKTEALESFLQSFELSKQLKDTKQIAFLINEIGRIQLELGNYADAMEYAQQALNFFVDESNLEGQGTSLMLLGSIHTKLGNLKLAEDYLNKSIFILKRINNPNLEGMANLYMGELKISQNKNDEALEILSNAASLLSKKDAEKGNLAIVLRHYAVALAASGRLKEAETMARNSLLTLGKSYNITELAKSWLTLADIHFDQNKITESQNAYNRSLEYAKEGELKDQMRKAYYGLANVSEQQNQRAKAFEYLKEYTKLNDSILGLNQLSRVNNLETQLASLKKNRELEVKQLQVQQRDLQVVKLRNRITILIAILLILATVIYYAYRLNRHKREANSRLLEQNSEIEAQSDELLRQNRLVEKRNKDITNSIEYAERIQKAIVPIIPTLDGLLNTFVVYLPKDIVSGDFYWFKQRGDLLYFAVADCTGHGVPGAFMSIVGNFGLNKIVSEDLVTEPAKILTSLHSLFIKTLIRRDRYDIFDGMDIGLCVLNLTTLELQFAGANIPLCLVRSSEQEEPSVYHLLEESLKHKMYMLKPNKQAVGADSNFKPFDNHTLQLLPRDTLYLYSDGFPDQFGGGKFKKYRTQELRRKLLNFQQRTMHSQSEILLKEFYRWKGNCDQVDDVTVLGVRISKSYSV
ncbi:SpoIIE family protein phosphatase [Williamwhitmania taraxaci]|uniref:Serine phosphatase RsbU, regulator of sigma subunit n=1 Tax=Williamwhitmania taraxaci TaxID=1640674 RepID=A0A1G6GNK7_9BACT|nr:SpoIIE family protein phosphatase [Williamwhitmania taraxaci]SDB83580.1 Serine phosphatase RsbU, regulator of sigma subunit [Williamwhitmania taraxaci]